MNNALTRRFPAEWEAQDAVLLAWPHEQTDWSDQLEEAQRTFCEIIRAISHFEKVILLVPEKSHVHQALKFAHLQMDNICLFEAPYNDTWARDFGPLSVQTDQGVLLLDFIFNGWGNKFRAELDNQLTRKLSQAGAFGDTSVFSIPLVLEGGSLESDGSGTLLTTCECLLQKKRNPHLGQQQITTELMRLFGATQILWLEHGALKGDDTDSHIDTLARFAPDKTIIFQGCRDRADVHYSALKAMHHQLEGFKSLDGGSYRLLELPWPQPSFDAEEQRLPATYANFLVINGAVLVPTYKDPSDELAIGIIAQAFPHREIIPIDCCALIKQHGSLHCVTMQLPRGVLS